MESINCRIYVPHQPTGVRNRVMWVQDSRKLSTSFIAFSNIPFPQHAVFASGYDESEVQQGLGC